MQSLCQSGSSSSLERVREKIGKSKVVRIAPTRSACSRLPVVKEPRPCLVRGTKPADAKLSAPTLLPLRNSCLPFDSCSPRALVLLGRLLQWFSIIKYVTSARSTLFTVPLDRTRNLLQYTEYCTRLITFPGFICQRSYLRTSIIQ